MELNYDALIRDYDAGLHDKLRKFTTGHDFLGTWVPDEDPNQSIFGIFEAAQTAGLEENLDVRISPEISGGLDTQWLEQETKPFGELRVEDWDGSIGLRFTFTQSESGSAPTFESFKSSRPVAPTVLSNVDRQRERVLPLVIHSRDRSPSDINEKYRKGVEQAAKGIQHEGYPTVTSEDQKTRFVESEGLGLQVVIDEKGIILNAVHLGAVGLDRVLLDQLCEAIVGLSLQEAADHGVLRMEFSLRDPHASGIVRGILTPENGDPAFRILLRLIRKLYNEYLVSSQTKPARNFWRDEISSAWAALSEEERIARANDVLYSALQRWGLSDTGTVIHEIKNQTRVVVSFSGEAEGPELGHLMMRLERELRSGVEPQLELLLCEQGDKNKPREQKAPENG